MAHRNVLTDWLKANGIFNSSGFPVNPRVNDGSFVVQPRPDGRAIETRITEKGEALIRGRMGQPQDDAPTALPLPAPAERRPTLPQSFPPPECIPPHSVQEQNVREATRALQVALNFAEGNRNLFLDSNYRAEPKGGWAGVRIDAPLKIHWRITHLSHLLIRKGFNIPRRIFRIWGDLGWAGNLGRTHRVDVGGQGRYVITITGRNAEAASD